MASADCACCGKPVTAPEPVEIDNGEECDCGCCDCSDCGECYHEEDVVIVQPDALCDGCKVCDGAGDCDPLDTWHCDGRYGHHCDGTGCEERAAAIGGVRDC
jgi:hypothetical protein